MSVLMRGADMPKNCEECNFKGECRQYWEKIREAYTRPSWCPLVEVADTPQTEKNCDNCGTKTEACYFCDTGRNMWTPQTEDFQDWKDRMWAEAVIEPQTERSE